MVVLVFNPNQKGKHMGYLQQQQHIHTTKHTHSQKGQQKKIKRLNLD